MVELAEREVGRDREIAISAGWTICEVPIPKLHLASHPEMAPPTHPSLHAMHPSPAQALSESCPRRNIPHPQKLPESMPLLSPASLLPQARSVRQSHVVNGILFVTSVVGKCSGWTSPNLQELCPAGICETQAGARTPRGILESSFVHLSPLPTVNYERRGGDLGSKGSFPNLETSSPSLLGVLGENGGACRSALRE